LSFLSQRLRSIGFALQGVKWLVLTQPNARVHMFATSAVALAGWFFQITPFEWALLIGVIGAVWTAEALNTAIEWAVDLASPTHHVLAGKAKDVAAAGVLLASLAAVCVGVLVFWPYVANRLG
jgi:diacylglycerol kinase (ATP)